MAYLVSLFFLLFCGLSAEAQDVRLITNFKDNSYQKMGPVKERDLEQPIYDLSFVAYDKEFAEEFAMVPDYITEMDEGLRWIEIAMRTERRNTKCYYNLILDKSVKVDFPEENFLLRSQNPKLNLTWDYDKTDNERKYRARDLVSNKTHEDNRRFSNRMHLANYDYIRSRYTNEYEGGLDSLSLEYYIQDIKPPYETISASGSCLFAEGIFKNSESPASIWIGDNPDTNYNALIGIHRDAFKRFRIPGTLIEQITPYLIQHRQLVHQARRK